MDYDFFKELLTARREKLINSLLEKDKALREWNSFSDDSDLVAAHEHGNNIISIMEVQKKEIQEIEYVLDKIKSKTYGICEMCDDEIDIQRLNVKPHARFCINCREFFEKTQNIENKYKNLKASKKET